MRSSTMMLMTILTSTPGAPSISHECACGKVIFTRDLLKGTSRMQFW